MTEIKTETKTHPTEAELAGFLGRSLSDKGKEVVELHIASCPECLERIVSAHESVEEFRKGGLAKKGKANPMKKINFYLVLAIISFLLSFTVPQYFVQFLLATLLLGIKWIVDSKSTKMLIMIYEAWKKGGEKEASHILETLNSGSRDRFQP
ncbi:MAG: hypothetical protein HZA30_04625 [Candidatus Omnitrophica bacterium]|nr:hypothetical protein [Candidatus Omnitrophota bacterium]MBI5144333.1 hypothetical protein [Candidatus Omnitrophota bacterium]